METHPIPHGMRYAVICCGIPSGTSANMQVAVVSEADGTTEWHSFSEGHPTYNSVLDKTLSVGDMVTVGHTGNMAHFPSFILVPTQQQLPLAYIFQLNSSCHWRTSSNSTAAAIGVHLAVDAATASANARLCNRNVCGTCNLSVNVLMGYLL